MSFTEPKSILRYLARVAPAGIYGGNALQSTEVCRALCITHALTSQADHWVDFAASLSSDKAVFATQLATLNKHLTQRTFFLGNAPSFSVADIVVFAFLAGTRNT